MDSVYISDRDFADMVGLPIKYVQRMLRDGKGPSYLKVGRYTRIKRDVAMKWIEEHTTEST